MMETLESMLTPEETRGAEKFFQRLGEADLRNVQKVLSAVDRTVKEYFGANELNYSTIPYLISYTPMDSQTPYGAEILKIGNLC